MGAETQEIRALLREAVLERDLSAIRQMVRELDEPEFVAVLGAMLAEVPAPKPQPAWSSFRELAATVPAGGPERTRLRDPEHHG